MRQSEINRYILWSKMSAYKNKISAAQDKIRHALTLADNWHVAYSGGKDSTVLIDMLVKIGWRGDMVQFRYSEFETPPCNIELGMRTAKKYGLAHIVVDAYSCMQAWDEIGHFYCIPQTAEEKKLAKFADTDFRNKSLELIQKNQYGGLFWGLRKKESNLRNLAMTVWGDTYFAKCRGIYTSAPLANLTDDDIWAYICSNELEYLSVYDNPIIPRCDIRNELNYMCTKKAIFNGVFEKYEILWPNIIHALKSRYGEIIK